jgi:hypothetical protein
MGFSADVILTTLQELRGPYEETFTKFHPAFEAIIAKGQKKKAKGPYIQFGLVPEGPGSTTTLRTGVEVIQGGRRQTGVRGSAYAATMIHAWDVPGQDLREADGEADLLDIMQKYPERALDDFQQQIGRQLVSGGERDVSAILTFNSDQTYDPKGLGAESGVFEYVASGTQSNTTFGVAKNSIDGWYHQYEHINSFSAEGRRKMSEAYYDASTEGTRAMGDVDLIFADRGSYHEYLTSLDDQVQIVDRDLGKGDHRPSAVRGGVKFLNATMYLDREIVTSRFTTAAPLLGVMFGIHSSTWKLFSQGSDSNMETIGDFSFRGPDYLITQDMWRYQYVLSLGIYCDNLRCNFAVTGGAQA